MTSTAHVPATATLEQQLLPLAGRLADVQAQIAELQNTERALKTAIRALVPGPDSYQAGDIAVVVQANRKFDPDKAVALLPQETIEGCTRTTVDPALLKQHLTPAQLDDCMVPAGELKVGLK